MGKKSIGMCVVLFILGMVFAFGGQSVLEKQSLREYKGHAMANESKANLLAFIDSQAADIESQWSNIKKLEDKLAGIGESVDEKPIIGELGDGTGRLSFNSKDGKITLPSQVLYPGSVQSSSTGSVNITESIKMVPTDKWSVVQLGSGVRLSHSSGIDGEVKVGKIEELADLGNLRDKVLPDILRGYPQGDVQYSTVYLDDNKCGVQAVLSSRIDGEVSGIRVGMLGVGETSMVYMFSYRESDEFSKGELVLSLLRSMKIYGQDLRLEM